MQSIKSSTLRPNRNLIPFLIATGCVIAWHAGSAAESADGKDPLTQSNQISIVSNFPGGNIIVDDIQGDSIRLHQDERDTPRFWFYWCFEVQNAQGRTLTFTFAKGNVFGSRGPAFSVDGGESWDWLGTTAVNGDSFQYTFGTLSKRVRFAFAIPYLQRNLQEFLKRHRSNPAIKLDELVKSPKQRAVELIRAGRIDGQAKYRVLLTSRHHACESIATFVLEGVLEAALAEEPIGRWFREQAEIIAVPFMDKDGVEDGDQGKMRKPFDHWLDYEGRSRYAETRALRTLFENEKPSRPVQIAIDLHCPYIRDTKIYFALGSSPQVVEPTIEFCRIFEQLQTGSLVYHMADNSPYGTGWNVAATYADCRSFWQWAQTLPGVRVAATLEIPYASVGDVVVTPVNARLLGRDLAATIHRFLDTGR